VGLAPVVPECVVRTGQIGFGSSVASIRARSCFLVERCHFFIVENIPACLTAGPFERREVGVGPRPLQIGLAPGRSRRRVFLRGCSVLCRWLGLLRAWALQFVRRALQRTSSGGPGGRADEGG